METKGFTIICNQCGTKIDTRDEKTEIVINVPVDCGFATIECKVCKNKDYPVN